MLHPAGLTPFQWTVDNWGVNPAATIGTSVVPGASNALGNWTTVLTSANMAQDAFWVYMQIHAGASTNNAKNHLLDLGIDPAGGTNFTPFISNMQVGSSPALSAAGAREFYFPCYIPAGSSVGVRVRGSNATAGTVRAAIRVYGQPARPELVPRATVSETFGADTATSLGTGITPGNATDGAWIDLGATTKPLWWWQLGYGINASTITAEYTYFEVAWGNSTNKHTMFKVMHGGTTAETCGLSAQTQMLACASFNPVPVGQNIYVRARCNNAPDTGYHVTVTGIGG